jgi:decaprenylphospho-beta-D-ribofuranose 2-oxidase
MLDDISEAGHGQFPVGAQALRTRRGPLFLPVRGLHAGAGFPGWRPQPRLIERLDRITLDHGGRFYLAKDARMSAETFLAADPRFAALRDLRRAAAGPERFTSLQSERLGL